MDNNVTDVLVQRGGQPLRTSKRLTTWLKTSRLLPVLSLLAGFFVLWYLATYYLNGDLVTFQEERDGVRLSSSEFLLKTMSLERPVLPAPHQIAKDLWQSIFKFRITSKRNLLYHAGVTLSSTLTGFAIGSFLGILLATGIVHVRALETSLMPWVITSQTVPILAIAPLIVVMMGSIGLTGVLPKAVISAYLSFFPVTIGMVRGLRSPDPLQMDLFSTWAASHWQRYWALRLPASLPWLFASLKLSAALSVTGAIVGELPTGSRAGLGARLLAGSYYGQTVQIWSALILAACLAASLVILLGLLEGQIIKRRGGPS